MTVHSRSHRILKGLKRYEDLSEKKSSSRIAPDGINLNENEELIGIYRNPGPPDASVVVTELGLRFKQAKRWSLVRFDDVEEVSVHPPGKHEANSILLLLHSGEEVAVPIRGKNGKFRDVFEFLRFLDRVREDRK